MRVVEPLVLDPARAVPPAQSRILERLGQILFVPLPAAQGVHLDPEAQDHEPNPDLWPRDHRTAWHSEEMKLFCACLRRDGMDIRNSVLDDLATYYELPVDEVLRRCLHWEQWSVDEWRAGDRSTREGLQEFYNSVQSWSFDLLWYAYLQARGYGVPGSVLAARFAREKCRSGRHLDFGSGVGVTSQLFARLGFESTAADVSQTLLDFAGWRHQRHGDRVTRHDLTDDDLPSGHFDVVTAIDSLTHVPDFDATARLLHRIIRPGGWLLANFDVRQKGSDESAWHLYENELDLEYRQQRVGFVRRGRIGDMLLCYQRVDPRSLAHRLRTARDRLVYRPPIGPILSACRRFRWPTPERLQRLMRRVLR